MGDDQQIQAELCDAVTQQINRVAWGIQRITTAHRACVFMDLRPCNTHAPSAYCYKEGGDTETKKRPTVQFLALSVSLPRAPHVLQRL